MSNWWSDKVALERFVCDLIAGELQRLRPGAILRVDSWSPASDLIEDLGCDSLELTELAMAMAEVVQMQRTGLEDYFLARRTIGAWTEIVAASLERVSDELTFRTSGSTGNAKPCDHRLADLLQEIDALAGLLGPRKRILAAVPSHHIYGFLFTVLLPQRLGCQVLDVRQRTPRSVAAEMKSGDLVIGHPAFWTAFLRSPLLVELGVTGVTSTAPCPDEVVAGCLDHGLDRLVQVYGSSETGGVGWREGVGGDYRLFQHWAKAADGEGLVRTRADASALLIQAQDRLEWSGSRSFRIAGRKDEAVQVGGHNVFPQAVRACLMEHPGVADAAVRLMAPHEGARLKAFIVPADTRDLDILRAQLSAWCEDRLTPPQRPKAFNFGLALPRTHLGKLAEWDVEVVA